MTITEGAILEKHEMNARLVGLTVAYRLRGSLTAHRTVWVPGKLRKPSRCESCQHDLRKGQIAWRPMCEEYRQWRLCDPCVKGHEKA